MSPSSLHNRTKRLDCLNDADMLRLLEAFSRIRETQARTRVLALAERYANANPSYAELKQHFDVSYNMAFQVRVGSLIVIARSRLDAIRFLDRLSEGRSFDDVRVCDMNGKHVDVDRLRAGLDTIAKCEN